MTFGVDVTRSDDACVMRLGRAAVGRIVEVEEQSIVCPLDLASEGAPDHGVGRR
jgi:hypothetical protein